MKIKVFTVVFSNKCNLTCKYCYVKDSQLIFPKEKLVDLLKFIDNLEKDSNFSITIFGGEPLINKNLLKNFITIINNKYPIQIITNGTLLDDDFIKFCKNYLVTFNVSLDGCENCHNLNRVYKNGDGSFLQTYNAIKRLQKLYNYSKENFIGTAVITPNNYHYLLDNIKFLKEEKFSINFSFDYYSDWSKIDLNEYKKLIFSAADYYIQNIKELPYIGFFYLSYLSFLSTKNKSCCSSGERKITIAPDLKLYPCPSYINTNESIGDLYNGIDSNKLQNFLSKKEIIENECQDCKYFPNKNCYGKCIASNQPFLSNLCKIFFINLQMNLYVREKLKDNPIYLKYLIDNGGKL